MKLAIELNGKFMIRFLKKYLVMILLIGVIGGFCSVIVSLKSQGVEYSSEGHLVQNDNNYNIISSYQQFVESSRFAKIVSGKVDSGVWKDKSYKRDYKVTLSPEGSTSPFFTITVVSSNPEFSKYLANEAMHLFVTNIGKYLSGANTAIMSNADTAKTIDFKASLGKTASAGVIAGVVLAAIVAILHLIWIGKVKDDKYIHDVYELNHLATINLQDGNK